MLRGRMEAQDNENESTIVTPRPPTKQQEAKYFTRLNRLWAALYPHQEASRHSTTTVINAPASATTVATKATKPRKKRARKGSPPLRRRQRPKLELKTTSPTLQTNRALLESYIHECNLDNDRTYASQHASQQPSQPLPLRPRVAGKDRLSGSSSDEISTSDFLISSQRGDGRCEESFFSALCSSFASNNTENHKEARPSGAAASASANANSTVDCNVLEANCSHPELNPNLNPENKARIRSRGSFIKAKERLESCRAALKLHIGGEFLTSQAGSFVEYVEKGLKECVTTQSVAYVTALHMVAAQEIAAAIQAWIDSKTQEQARERELDAISMGESRVSLEDLTSRPGVSPFIVERFIATR